MKQFLGSALVRISPVILGSHIDDAKILHFYLFLNEMIVYFNVFRAGMKNWIGGKISHTNVVTP